MDYNISIRAVIDVIEDFPHGDVWNVESMEEMVDRIKQVAVRRRGILRMVYGLQGI